MCSISGSEGSSGDNICYIVLFFFRVERYMYDDEWATTKQACRDELVLYFFFLPQHISFSYICAASGSGVSVTLRLLFW